jgi:hypothetical protein
MRASPLNLIKRCAEYLRKEDADSVRRGTRGLYILYNYRPRRKSYEVVYVGLSKTGVRSRLRAHCKSERKRDLWTHFSVFEVWDNISDAQVAELEGLFRHIYRKDARANRLCVQRRFNRLGQVRQDKLADW